MREKKSRKGFWKTITSHKTAATIIIVVAIAAVMLFTTKLYLYVNLLLGNDIIVKLEANRNDFLLTRFENETVKFNANVVINPFCRASCRSVFEDIGRNMTIDREEFELSQATPVTFNYTLKAESFGSGQNLYRFSMDCESKKTAMCHTEGKATSRNILITAEYDLNDEEKRFKAELGDKLMLAKEGLANSTARFNALKTAVTTIRNSSFFEDDARIESTGNALVRNRDALINLRSIWLGQDYSLLSNEIRVFEADIQTTDRMIDSIYEKASQHITANNQAIENLKRTRDVLLALYSFNYTDSELWTATKDNAAGFNFARDLFGRKINVAEKLKTSESALQAASKAYSKVISGTSRLALSNYMDSDITHNVFCSQNITCTKRPTMQERSVQEPDLIDSCRDIDALWELYHEISRADANISIDLSSDARRDAVKNFLEELPKNNTNSEIIRTLLEEKMMGEGLPEKCAFITDELPKLKEANYTELSIPQAAMSDIGIDFPKPPNRCCYLGKCGGCCETDECRANSTLFPVVLIHGHAFNKDTESEYSLDSFNDMQEELEKNGYINAGAISLYTPHSIQNGVWGLAAAPVTIKASYYFDVFQNQESYVLVNTKSENIDTYAIRLRDLIEATLSKTGKPKVKIVAHSMGGLVARRYIQIFGADKVDRLIMIGTPNKGIEGNIADYCPLLGEKLECRDMNKDSLFMNKLNNAALPDIPIYNIIGLGCDMDKKDGDGIVPGENVELKGVPSIMINGTCKGVRKLHSAMLDSTLHPEVDSIVKELLK